MSPTFAPEIDSVSTLSHQRYRVYYFCTRVLCHYQPFLTIDVYMFIKEPPSHCDLIIAIPSPLQCPIMMKQIPLSIWLELLDQTVIQIAFLFRSNHSGICHYWPFDYFHCYQRFQGVQVLSAFYHFALCLGTLHNTHAKHSIIASSAIHRFSYFASSTDTGKLQVHDKKLLSCMHHIFAIIYQIYCPIHFHLVYKLLISFLFNLVSMCI